jgi:hypothetical protein
VLYRPTGYWGVVQKLRRESVFELGQADKRMSISIESPGSQPKVGMVRNIGEPIRLQLENMAGFAGESAREGQRVKLITAISTTSDDPIFHRLIEGFSGVIAHATQKAGIGVRLDRAETVLMVLKEDHSAELWVDTAAVSIECITKRALKAGQAVFDGDIADVIGMKFPCVEILPTDRVLCFFRCDWRFGLAFDFNPNRNLDATGFFRALGALYRQIRYRHVYDLISNQAHLDALIAAGWFPFVEILSREFRHLQQHIEAGFPIADAEVQILEGFDKARMDHILTRWLSKPHFSGREALLRVAFDAYDRKEPVAVIKILLTELEGILNDAHRAAAGRGTKLNKLLDFAKKSALHKAGAPDTLFLSESFADYLDNHTFANVDPRAGSGAGTAGSRHAVSHGAADQATYSMSRALQVILTLDQIAFYT